MKIDSLRGRTQTVVSSTLTSVGRLILTHRRGAATTIIAILALILFPIGVLSPVSGQEVPPEDDVPVVGDPPPEEIPTRLQTFVTEREFDRVFDRIEKSIQKKDWVSIADALLQLQVEDPGLLTRYRGSIASVSVAATRVLTQLPPEGLAVYRRLAEPVAAEKLRQALSDNDVDALREVARCYRLTSSSDRAFQLLAARLIDLGEWEEATLLTARPGASLPSHRLLADLNRTQRGKAGLSAEGDDATPPESLKYVTDHFPSRIPEWESSIDLHPLVRETLTSTFRELRESGLGPYPSMSLADADGVIIACGPAQWTGLNPATGDRLWSREIPGYMSNWMRSPGDLSNMTRHRMFAISVARRVFDETLTSRTTVSGSFMFLVEMISLEDPIAKVNEDTTEPPPPASRIVCVNSRTGEQVWTFDGHPAAEIYFSGPPAVFGDRVYALGESTVSGSMTLFTLEASTGKLLHSLEMAASLSSVNREEFRKGQAARIEIHQGQLICATGEGLIISIDPLFGEITWSVRMPQSAAIDDLKLEQSWTLWSSSKTENWRGWQEVQLFQTGDHLIYVTPASNQIFILDQQTGNLIRQIPRGEAIHLVAAPSPPSLMLIEKRSMRSVDLATGKTRWESVIPQPAGRGVLIGGTYLFPVFESEIAQVDVESGTVKSSFQSQLTPTETYGVLPYRLRPRQLVSLSGELFELGLQGVRKLQSPQQVAHLARFQSRYEEILNHVERGEGTPFIAELKKLIQDAPERDSKEVVSLRRMLRSLLLDQFRQKEGSAGENELEESIRSVSPMPLERAHWRQVRAGAALDQSNWDEFLSLWLESPVDELSVILPAEQDDLRSRLDRWFQAEAERFLLSQPPESRDKTVRQLLDRLPPPSELTKEEAERLQLCVGLVSASRPWRVQFPAVEEPAAVRAQQKLDWLLMSKDEAPAVSAGAASHLLASAMQSRRWGDARRWLRALETSPGDVVLPGGKSVSVVVPELKNRLEEASRSDPYDRTWPEEGEPQVKLLGGSSREVLLLPLPVQTERGSFFETLNVEMDFPGRRALRWNGAGWSRPWYQKLPPPPGAPLLVPGPMQCWGFEDIGVLQYGGDVYGFAALNVTGGRSSQILWPPKSERMNTVGKRDNLMVAFKTVERKIRPGFEISHVEILDEFLHPMSSVGPVRAGYFCILQQGMLVAMKTATGEEIWRRYDLPERPFVFGDDRMIGVISPRAGTLTVSDATDGRVLRKHDWTHHTDDIISVDGMGLVTAHGDPRLDENSVDVEDESEPVAKEPSPPETSPGKPVILQRHDFGQNSANWKREWASGTIPFEMDRRWIGMLSPDGKMEFVDLQSGKTIQEHQLTIPKPVERIFCGVTRDDFLVMVTTTSDQDGLSGSSGEDVLSGYRNPFVRGAGFCFSRETGEKRWETDGFEGHFRLDQPVDLPVFVLMTVAVPEEELHPDPDPEEAPPEAPDPPSEPMSESEGGEATEEKAEKKTEEAPVDEPENVEVEFSPPRMIFRCYDRRTGKLLQELRDENPHYAIVGDLQKQRITLFTMNSRVEIDFSTVVEEPAKNR